MKKVVKKTTKRAAKKAPKKTTAKTTKKAVGETGPQPSVLPALDDATPQDISLLQVMFEAWGLFWVPNTEGGGKFYRLPSFSFEGPDGKRWREQPEEYDYILRRRMARQHFEPFQLIRLLPWSGHRISNYEWFVLWAQRSTAGLDSFSGVDDTTVGDNLFFGWVELLIAIDEISDMFRGTNSDIWRSMEYARWTQAQGAGLALLSHLNRWGEHAFFGVMDDDPRKVFAPQEGILSQEQDLLDLRRWAPEVLSKVIEVLQSPAMEARFRAFFGAVARHLNLSNEELYESLNNFGNKSAFDRGGYTTLLQAKIGQVFGLLRDHEGPTDNLTSALEEWVRWMAFPPKHGWPIGEQYEVKAKRDRLKLISDRQRRGMKAAPQASQKLKM